MNVAILLGPNGRGGMERQAFLLAQGLIKNGISTRIMFNSRPSKSKEGMDWKTIPCQYTWRFRPLLFLNKIYLALWLKKHKIDILHVFFWGNMKFCVGVMQWVPNVKFIGSQRSTDFVTNSSIKDHLTRACRAYEYVSCNCKATRDLMIDLHVCPSEKIEMIYNGVLIPEEDSRNRENMRQGNSKIILFPNRFFSRKNPLLFIEACSEIVKYIDNVKIYFAGWGNLLDAMTERCEELGIMDKCKFLGSLLPEEIPYSAVDLVVNCPSEKEGLSNVLLEGLSYGVPVLATTVGGSPELLGDQCFGRLVPINDKEAMVRAMRDLLLLNKDQRIELKKQALSFLSENFSIETYINKHITFYKHVLYGQQTTNINQRESKYGP